MAKRSAVHVVTEGRADAFFGHLAEPALGVILRHSQKTPSEWAKILSGVGLSITAASCAAVGQIGVGGAIFGLVCLVQSLFALRSIHRLAASDDGADEGGRAIVSLDRVIKAREIRLWCISYAFCVVPWPLPGFGLAFYTGTASLSISDLAWMSSLDVGLILTSLGAYSLTVLSPRQRRRARKWTMPRLRLKVFALASACSVFDAGSNN